jgi:osmoprotectant transport system substrate-binding protein
VLPGANRPTIALGDENTPEQFVLGDLYRVALTDQGFSVSISQNIGTSPIAQQAMAQGTLDLYPAYLNQWDTEVAKQDGVFSSRQAALDAGESYADAHGMQLLNPSPGSDTYGLAVTSQYARANRLHSLADLALLPTPFVLGAPLEFSVSGGGLAAVETAYAFKPGSVQSINVGSQYGDLAAGTIQVGFVQTTDWELARPELATRQFTLLADPKHILGFGNVVPVTTKAVLAAEGLDFAATIDHVTALLSTKMLRELNAAVELDGENPQDVATTFLALNGIIPPGDGS